MDRNKQLLQYTVNDYTDEPAKVVKLVKENYISDFERFKSANKNSYNLKRSDNTPKSKEHK